MADMSASATLLVLAAEEFDKDKVTPGVLGFIVFAVMALAVWGLMKSMSKHMERAKMVGREDEEADGAVSPASSSSAKE
ncbi:MULTISPECIES: hypothetical protein [Streptomyces]|uniref:hypothetical protein n=1 Tax=Streptomyces TaxID=1883 RepID=UPI001F10176B|nr:MULTISPECIES: hypothetical protein [Streptomyces]MDH6225318.1 hypothetical protein [Streptomyces sp. MJP52]